MRMRMAWIAIALGAAAGCARGPKAATGPEREAMRVLDTYMAAFNARDTKAWAATLHYPHVRIAGGEVKTWERPEDYARDLDLNLFAEKTGWARSAWDWRRVVQSGPDKVHLAVRFSRYRADGSKIADYDSLYVVTLKDGRWGIQARSSFAP